MNSEAIYSVSKSITIQVSPDGRIVARNSVSNEPQELTSYALYFLMRFVQPASPREVYLSLTEEWDIEEQVFETVVKQLISLGFLVPENKGVQDVSLHTKGFASIFSHHHMLKDSLRVLSYKAAIEKHVKGKNVLEIGCGTGILSLFAAKAGAAKVTAIEETTIGDLAKKMFKANGFDNIQLVAGNSKDVTIAERADVIIHEIIATDPFAENILDYINDARKRFLKEGGRLIPFRFEIRCVGVEMGDIQRTVLEAQYFENMYDLKFGPYINALASADNLRFANLTGNSDVKPKILSEECQVFDIDFYNNIDALEKEFTIDLNIKTAGELGWVLIYFIAHLDESVQLSNSPFTPTTHWGYKTRHLKKLVQVNPGDIIPLHVKLGEELGLQRLVIDLPVEEVVNS